MLWRCLSFYKEGDFQSFLISSAIAASVGIPLLAIGKGAEKSLNRRDGYVIVSVAWVTFSFRNVTLLYRGIYSKRHRCILRNHVGVQQYGRYYLK